MKHERMMMEMKERFPNESYEINQEDARNWLYSDIDELIDMDYNHRTEKGDTK